MARSPRHILPYRSSLAGTLLAAREAVMAPIRPALREANVTEQQWRVLRVLAEQHSMDAATIADTALLYPPSVTRILRELLSRELITRVTDANDGRRSIVAIAPAGRMLLDDTLSHTLRILDGYDETFGAKRLRALIDELVALTASIRRFAPDER